MCYCVTGYHDGALLALWMWLVHTYKPYNTKNTHTHTPTHSLHSFLLWDTVCRDTICSLVAVRIVLQRILFHGTSLFLVLVGNNTKMMIWLVKSNETDPRRNYGIEARNSCRTWQLFKNRSMKKLKQQRKNLRQNKNEWVQNESFSL